jgi:hypothetical protein
MTDPADEEASNEARRSTQGDAGEGDADSFGRGKAGSGARVRVARLSPQKLKEVMANWRELTAQELVDAVVEFFSEGPMRASANVVVSWTKSANAKSFAIVNWAIEAGDKAVRELARTRDRMAGRDSKGLKRLQSPKANTNKFGLNPGMNGPTGGPTGS